MIAGRECINPFIAEALTFKDVLKQFNLKEKTCAKHDPSWEFDHWFATQQAGKLLRVRAQDAILDAMPSADTGVLLGAAVDKLNEVRRSELVVFAGADHIKMVQDAITIITGLIEGVSPTDKNIAGYSCFFKLFLKRAEFFCKATKREQSEPDKGTLNFPKAVEIRGRDALQVLFEKFKDSVDGGAAPVLENLKPFKTYRWMLSDVQRVQYLEWVQQSSAVQGAKAAICGPSTANPGEGASSSASSTAIVAATPAVLSSRCAADELEGTKPAASTAYEKKKAAASDEKKAEMMQWFLPRAKRAKK